jgi:hypothetical protein
MNQAFSVSISPHDMQQSRFDHHILVGNVKIFGTVGDLMTHCKQLLGGIVVLRTKERLFKSDCFSDFNQQSTDG